MPDGSTWHWCLLDVAGKKEEYQLGLQGGFRECVNRMCAHVQMLICVFSSLVIA